MRSRLTAAHCMSPAALLGPQTACIISIDSGARKPSLGFAQWALQTDAHNPSLATATATVGHPSALQAGGSVLLLHIGRQCTHQVGRAAAFTRTLVRPARTWRARATRLCRAAMAAIFLGL